MNHKLNWVDAISVSPVLSMDKLRTMVETGLLDANSTGDISLAGSFLLRQAPHWREALDYLFAKGCSVDIQDDMGCNLLMTANGVWTSYDHEKTKFLLERGADPLLADKDGTTIVHIAEKYFSPKDRKKFFKLIHL
jgi:ankyrin repeat protein